MSAANDANPLKGHQHHALVLQGGGALGAYQAGVYEEVSATEYQPDWIVGVSIGALNGALIVGNPPGKRIQRLTEFWHLVSSGMGPITSLFPKGFGEGFQLPAGFKHPRSAFDEFSAMWSALVGIPGFYKPRLPPPMLQPDGAPGALSFYDMAPLRETLEDLVDFDLINSRKVRFSVGAANVRTGNSHYFDNFKHKIGPEHIMASCALPPSFSPVTIDGEDYWDGGLVTNTPLQYLLDSPIDQKMCVFQVDLFSAAGQLPINLSTVQQRRKDILYSSRTRYNSEKMAEIVNTRKAIRDLLAKLPEDLKDDDEVRHLTEITRVTPIDIFHLIYRQSRQRLESKYYEFSRASILEHWQCGSRDAHDTVNHPEWLKATGLRDGVTQYDLARHSREI